jgi:hypothetical protein
MKELKQAYVLPWHARTLQDGNSFVNIVADLVKVRDARIIVILAWKEGTREVCRMRVGKWVILGVPAAKTNIKTADTCAMIIDNNNFLVMRPKLDIIYKINTSTRPKMERPPLDPIWSG